LKTIQDLLIYSHLRNLRGLEIAEIGGGNSRLLEALAKNNKCFNIEKFEGADGGPKSEITFEGVQNLKVFLGDFSDELRPEQFDVVFSVSVIEHINDIKPFFEDGLRILKSGGLWLHAIDLYIEDCPSDFYAQRFDIYRGMVQDPRMEPLGPIFKGPLKFTCDLATNPDNTMYAWGKLAPQLTPLRQRAQSVSVIVGAKKK
jgi:SAM-dependent methyltransferase